MKAVVTKPGATGNLALAEAPEPRPDSGGGALIRVKAFLAQSG
jgi:hypothetical protein